MATPPVTSRCGALSRPASALRQHGDCYLRLDVHSAALLSAATTGARVD